MSEPILFDRKVFANYFGSKGLQRGVVKEVNKAEDSDKFNTVSVDLVEDGINLPFVQVMYGMAHNKSGTVYVPAQGDEVLVAFVNDDITKPIIIGCVYNSKNKSPLIIGKDNNAADMCIALPLKGEKKGAGIKIEIFCEKQKQKLKITTEKKHVIEVEDENETVSIREGEEKNKDGTTFLSLDFKNGTITMQAKDSIIMKADQHELKLDKSGGFNLKCSGKDFKVDVNNAEIKAKAKGTIEAQSGVDIKSTTGQVAIDGKGGAKVNTSAMLELKGSMTKIN